MEDFGRIGSDAESKKYLRGGVFVRPHGLRGKYSSEFSVWSALRSSDIKVCDRWENFAYFLADVGLRPSPIHRLDRIDRSGIYEKKNCQWITKKKLREKRGEINGDMCFATINGTTKSVSDWCEELGLSYSTAYYRITARGWTPEKAVTESLPAGNWSTEHFTEWSAWRNMHGRCENSKREDYHRYGGRGIKVCERWNSFENFLADMGKRPDGLTLERKDNDGDYEPDNCRWATKVEQARNRCNTKWHTLNGESKTIREWCEQFGISRDAVRSRLESGWDLERALTEPIALSGKRRAEEYESNSRKLRKR